MFADVILSQMIGNARSLNTQLLAGGLTSEQRCLVGSSIKMTTVQHGELTRAVRYWLEVEQARLFQSHRFLREGFPPMPHPATWIEFNGLLSFDYKVPTIVSSLAAEEMEAIESAKFRTAYRGVLIFSMHPPFWFSNTECLQPGESMYEAVWFEEPVPLEMQGYHQVISDSFNISFAKSSWPKLLAEDDRFMQGNYGPVHILETPTGTKTGHVFMPSAGVGVRESLAHAYRLFRMTVNLLYFLSAENQVFVRVSPEHSRQARGLPRSDHPYHVLPMQVQRYRYLVHGTGTGSRHSFKYDVRGHFRHLRDERFERNEDGSVKIVWVHPHQRGVDNPIYRSAVHTGKVSQRILEYDRFMQSVEDRLRRRRTSQGANPSALS